MELLKGIVGKLLTGAVVLAVAAGAISWWRMDTAEHQAVLGLAGRFAAWGAIVVAAPWATFGVIGKIGRLESNGAGAALVVSYTALEAVGLGWIIGWSLSTAGQWTGFAAAVLLSGIYNLFVCDWIAEWTLR